MSNKQGEKRTIKRSIKKSTEASQALVSYLDSYRQNPNFLEDLNPAVQAAKRQVDRKLPLPPYAKQQIIN